jgi:hypothetical protein
VKFGDRIYRTAEWVIFLVLCAALVGGLYSLYLAR